MIVIGEKINATRKDIAAAIQSRNEDAIAGLVKRQDEAGADVIDLNAGTGAGDTENAIDDMKWLVDVALRNTEKPVAIDSEHPGVIESALAVVSKRDAWINSVSAEPGRLEPLLALAREHSCQIVALCMGDGGMPTDVSDRMKAAEKIYKNAVDAGIEPSNLYFDPLVMPIATDNKAGMIILDCIRTIKDSLPGSKTVLGLSNVSFGLPHRASLNAAFLVLCMGAGLDAAIADPCDEKLISDLFAAKALLGKDPYCRDYITAFRKKQQEKEKKDGASI